MREIGDGISESLQLPSCLAARLPWGHHDTAVKVARDWLDSQHQVVRDWEDGQSKGVDWQKRLYTALYCLIVLLFWLAELQQLPNAESVAAFLPINLSLRSGIPSPPPNPQPQPRTVLITNSRPAPTLTTFYYNTTTNHQSSTITHRHDAVLQRSSVSCLHGSDHRSSHCQRVCRSCRRRLARDLHQDCRHPDLLQVQGWYVFLCLFR